MPLSFDNIITSDDIDHVAVLKEGKIWLLTGHHNPPDEIVIKIEPSRFVGPRQYRSVTPFVEAVDPAAGLKILTPQEINALRAFVDGTDHHSLAHDYRKCGLRIPTDEVSAIGNLKEALRTNQFTFVKMRVFDVKDLQTALDKRLAAQNRDKSDLRAFIAALNAPGGLERLGQIIAVDLFVGNNDRFDPTREPRDVDFCGAKINLRCLTNPGNVFCVYSNRGFKIGALDFIDPNSLFKNINVRLAEAETEAREEWSGRVLADTTKRNKFAKDIAHDLEQILNPRRSRFSPRTKLNRDAAERIAKGMLEGVELIKTKLQSLYYQNRWTAGKRDRYDVMWEAQFNRSHQR
jgi:hypothetical protein